MENIAPALLDWFYTNRRILPFREDPTPYHVWLSEIDVYKRQDLRYQGHDPFQHHRC